MVRKVSIKQKGLIPRLHGLGMRLKNNAHNCNKNNNKKTSATNQYKNKTCFNKYKQFKLTQNTSSYS